MRGKTWVLVAIVGLLAASFWAGSTIARTESADGVVTERQSLSGVDGGIRTKVAFEFDGTDHIGSVDGFNPYEVDDSVVVWFVTPGGDDALDERVDVSFDSWEIWLVPLLVVGVGLLWVAFELIRARRAAAKS